MFHVVFECSRSFCTQMGVIMLLGEKQTLKIVKTVEFGVYLAEENGDEEDKVLLPKKQMPPYSKLGDEIEVFLYRDSKDRLIATTNEPLITLGKIAKLKVVQTGEIGAFFELGTGKGSFVAI